MAFDIPGFVRGWSAGGTLNGAGDLSIARTVNSIAIDSYRYMFVKFAAGVLVPVTAATDKVVGILQNKPQPGQIGAVMLSGVSKVRTNDAAILIGSPLYIDAFGMAVTTVQAGQCIGVAEEVVPATGGYIATVCLKPFGAIS